MRRAVEGRLTVLRVLILASCLIALTFVTVAVTFLGVATAFAVRVLVLRVLLLRGVVGVEAVDLTGIGIDSDVYSSNIAIKNPLWGFSGHFVNWFSFRLIHHVLSKVYESALPHVQTHLGSNPL